MWISEKGVRYILSPKRGNATDINPIVSMPITAKGQSNWTGSFVSPDIAYIERSNEIGGGEPTMVVMQDGRVWFYDGRGEVFPIGKDDKVIDSE